MTIVTVYDPTEEKKKKKREKNSGEGGGKAGIYSRGKGSREIRFIQFLPLGIGSFSVFSHEGRNGSLELTRNVIRDGLGWEVRPTTRATMVARETYSLSCRHHLGYRVALSVIEEQGFSVV